MDPMGKTNVLWWRFSYVESYKYLLTYPIAGTFDPVKHTKPQKIDGTYIYIYYISDISVFVYSELINILLLG